MNFEFSAEQNLLREQAVGFLSDRAPLSVARCVLDGDETHASDVWQEIVNLGWTATAVPESHGGFGFGHLELCVLAEELGRSLAPVPFSSSVYLATEAVARRRQTCQRIIKTEAEGPGVTPELGIHHDRHG